MSNKSIYKRIAYIMLATQLIAIALSVTTVSYVAYQNFVDRKKEDLEQRITIIANSLSKKLWTFDHDSIQILGKIYTTHQDTEQLKIYSSLEEEPIFSYKRNGDLNTDIKSTNIIYNNKVIGHIELSLSQSEYQESINNIIISGILAAVFLILITMLATRRILRAFLQKPINTFSTWTTLVAAGKYNIKFDVKARELEKLAANFKTMAETISAREEKILHQATHDHLTSLPNRLLVTDRLENLILQSEKTEKHLAVMLLDIDNFKKINDSLGHETGDKLLIEVSSKLKSAIRESDTIGRLGGDEFIVLLGSLDEITTVNNIAKMLLNSLSSKFIVENRELVISASIGIACYPNDGKTVTELIRNADAAMYYAKNTRRNNYKLFEQTMNFDVSRNLLIEQEIHKGIQNNEFFLVYQPIINTLTGEITEAEALLRWNSTRIGSIYPDEFIPIAEQSGQIIELGKFVIESALKQTKVWMEKYQKHFTISVNISPQQLHDRDIVDFILHSLAKNNLQHHCLKLEITEGVLISGLSSTKELIEEINQHGIKISMDDFGTGYSSLRYLRDYPFDTLKIDRSFVNKITEDQTDQELVNAIVAMANSLAIDVVAEGVETAEQLQHLKKIECEYAQGYYISKPLSVSDFAEFLEEQLQRLSANQ